MGRTTHQAMDALDLLTSQHRAATGLFDVLADRNANAGEARWTTLLALEDALVAHGELEQRFLYPAFRAGEINALLDELHDDHRSVKRLLGALLALASVEREFFWLLEELRGVVVDHVIIEERELFPRLREQVPHEVLAELGERMLASLADRHRQAIQGTDLAAATP
jgi:hypothetical protein